MKRESNGSIIILILMVIASITIIMATAIKAVVFFYTLALERTEHLRQTKALEALALYGIAVGQTMYRNTQNQQYHQEFQSWPIQKGYKATITIIPQSSGYEVKAHLLGSYNQVQHMNSKVIREQNLWHITL